ncbi:S41 family peptidase [Deinococcus humi]|uniref:S41 family peptidase n=1 Tax=Deinococcus humi TaxID=662880 RepID=UPI0016076ABC|nr:hypothetical protein GCM10008949_53200 [Deinococcus humi]
MQLQTGDGTLPDGRLYQDVVQDLIAELGAAGAERWIIDLRLNEGGNMYPMLAGSELQSAAISVRIPLCSAF